MTLDSRRPQQGRRHARLPIAGIVGALNGSITGALVGFILGAINEARFADPAESDLFVGFAEYSASGLAFFGGIGCTIIGTVTGSVMEFVSRKTKSAVFPILAGAGSVATVVAIAASVTKFNQNQFNLEFAVWSIGGIVSLLTVKRICG
jgi:hypothetical protein